MRCGSRVGAADEDHMCSLLCGKNDELDMLGCLFHEDCDENPIMHIHIESKKKDVEMRVRIANSSVHENKHMYGIYHMYNARTCSLHVHLITGAVAPCRGTEKRG